MMKYKITLLLLLLTICSPVLAQEIYTDYIFIGYTNENRENDDLYKYEPLILHNFYRYSEIGIRYLENSEPIDGDQVDIDDVREEETLSQIKPTEDTPYTTYVLIKGGDNYITKQIVLKNAKSLLETGAKFRVYYGNKLQTETAEIVTDSDDLIFALGRSCAVDGLRLEIDYDIEELLKITYNPVNISSNLTIDQEITLYPKISSLSITSKIYYNYDKFLEENNLLGDVYITYYKYVKKLYKHFYYIKSDYTKSLEESIDGYQYDPEDDMTIYSIYKRERIIQNTDDQNQESDLNDVKDPIEELLTSTDDIKNETVITSNEKTTSVTQAKDSLITENLEEDTLTINRPSEILENEDIDKPDEKEECEENKRPLILKWLGISMLSISLISFIVHFICVKFKDEND